MQLVSCGHSYLAVSKETWSSVIVSLPSLLQSFGGFGSVICRALMKSTMLYPLPLQARIAFASSIVIFQFVYGIIGNYIPVVQKRTN